MTTISIQNAQASLAELIHRLMPGEELVITEDERPVARLRAATESRPQPRVGTLTGTVLFMAPDFDEPLDEFREYME